MKIIKSLVWKIISSRIGASIILSILGRFYIKQPLWLHVGGQKTGTTTLQEDIFPHHPQIGYLRSPKVKSSLLVFRKVWIFTLRYPSTVNFQKNHIDVGEFKKLLHHPYPRLKSPSAKSVVPKMLPAPMRSRLYLHSSELLSGLYVPGKKPLPEKVPDVVRRKTEILYIIRNEAQQLHSLWLGALSGVISSKIAEGMNIPFCGADQFARVNNPTFPPVGVECQRRFNEWGTFSTQTNVYRPKMFIKEVIPNWGREIHILPYELFMEEPKVYLDKISNLMDIDPKITWNLYKNARADKSSQDLHHPTNPHFPGSRGMAMRQRGLEFCRTFKHERRLYDTDWKLFFRTAEKYAATLPQQLGKAFTDNLVKIKNNWSGNSTLEIYKLATEPTFSNWLRGGEKAKPEFSKKTLERLRKIRAPQNRWLAKKFDLDLERYGYAM